MALKGRTQEMILLHGAELLSIAEGLCEDVTVRIEEFVSGIYRLTMMCISLGIM